MLKIFVRKYMHMYVFIYIDMSIYLYIYVDNKYTYLFIFYVSNTSKCIHTFVFSISDLHNYFMNFNPR